VVQVLPPAAIDHRWYRRPYYLGPADGAAEAYQALADALRRSRREGLARWTMRRKEYAGVLRLHAGRPMLVALRKLEEMIPVDQLEAPGGPKLDAKELGMARQLIEMLAADFAPEDYRDEYRARVEELIRTKAEGRTVRARRPREPRAADDLARALQASLEQERKRA
jgi:DNA end-binding protein Ku